MASNISKVYKGNIKKVFIACQKSVRDLGYKVDSINKEEGLVNFKTGMSWWSWAGQEMSVMMIAEDENSVEVNISGRRNAHGAVLQVYDWGEARGIAKKLLAKMDEYLG